MAKSHQLTREESKALTRARLIAAAREIFVERGFHAAKMETIASRAGFTVGALYSNFPAGKTELFVAVFDQYQSERAREIEEAVTAAEAPQDQPWEAAAQWRQKLVGEPGWFPLFMEFWAHAVRDPQLRDRFAISFSRVRFALARIVTRHARQGGMELPLPAEQVATIIKALGNGLALETFAEPDSVPDDLLGTALSIFARGLEATPRQGTPLQARPT